eukprot:2216329-Prymnesium_polylepis.1
MTAHQVGTVLKLAQLHEPSAGNQLLGIPAAAAARYKSARATAPSGAHVDARRRLGSLVAPPLVSMVTISAATTLSIGRRSHSLCIEAAARWRVCELSCELRACGALGGAAKIWDGSSNKLPPDRVPQAKACGDYDVNDCFRI